MNYWWRKWLVTICFTLSIFGPGTIYTNGQVLLIIEDLFTFSWTTICTSWAGKSPLSLLLMLLLLSSIEEWAHSEEEYFVESYNGLLIHLLTYTLTIQCINQSFMVRCACVQCIPQLFPVKAILEFSPLKLSLAYHFNWYHLDTCSQLK